MSRVVDLGFWVGAACRRRDDWLRGDPLVPGPRGDPQLDALQPDWSVVSCFGEGRGAGGLLRQLPQGHLGYSGLTDHWVMVSGPGDTSSPPPAVDIWSVGCIMAEMLTGKTLFKGKDCILCWKSQTPPRKSFLRQMLSDWNLSGDTCSLWNNCEMQIGQTMKLVTFISPPRRNHFTFWHRTH